MKNETITISRKEYERLKKIEQETKVEELSIVDDITEGLKDISKGNFKEI